MQAKPKLLHLKISIYCSLNKNYSCHYAELTNLLKYVLHSVVCTKCLICNDVIIYFSLIQHLPINDLKTDENWSFNINIFRIYSLMMTTCINIKKKHYDESWSIK